ncbi:response regulator transcription factor [Reichenbachiella agarivorans]|uniref:Response regulator transcription factor n=1 Tax=Reichenbachiella agarivorans TaxID=2979464 RepID=A0ABY6CM85_9BACT|nr:response regulator transcription factor [Reichenbachiella agarivorans]UXP31489.1 response regulator transcription factor [Reichenbachiella agarivorans]
MLHTQSVIIADTNFLSMQGLQKIVASDPNLQLIQSHDEINSSLLNNIHQADIWIINVSRNTESLVTLAIKAAAHSRVLAIASTQEEKHVKRLWSRGIQSIVTDHCSEEEISQALNQLSLQKKFYCNTILDLVSQPNEPKPFYDLSKREMDVLSLITKGKTSREISEILFLSPHTVNSHRKNILKKLDLKSPAELIVFAIDKGLMD